MTSSAAPAGRPPGPPEVLCAMGEDTFQKLFDTGLLRRLGRVGRLRDPLWVGEFDSAGARARLAATEVLVTGWGCPPLTAEVLDRAPALRAIAHAGGSVRQHVTEACWRRGILVSSAAEANAIPVAEYTLAAILMAGKRVPQFAAEYRRHPGSWSTWRDRVPAASNYHRTVGIVGLSRIGRRVAGLLRPFDLTVLAYDPYAAPQLAEQLGVKMVDLDTLVRRSDIVTLHAPALPETRHLLDARRLGLMRDHTTVINTARGSLIDTAALTAECVAGRLSAILDVTDPEPLPAGSALYDLPNVLLTPHIAGAMHDELHRLAEVAIDEVGRIASGQPLQHQIRPEQMRTSA